MSWGAKASQGSVPLTSHPIGAVGRQPSPAPRQPPSTQLCPTAAPQHPALPHGGPLALPHGGPLDPSPAPRRPPRPPALPHGGPPAPGQPNSSPPSWFLLWLCPCWRHQPAAESCPGGVTVAPSAGQSGASARDTCPFPCRAEPSLRRGSRCCPATPSPSRAASRPGPPHFLDVKAHETIPRPQLAPSWLTHGFGPCAAHPRATRGVQRGDAGRRTPGAAPVITGR